MSTEPLVIAHRGACGYLPEHTREAKMLAYGQNADFLEQDVVATRDGRLVVLHDLFLDDVTDVSVRFPGRHRGDGRHYVIDFDLEELLQLRVVERRRPGEGELMFPERFRDEDVTFRITTLDEEIRLIRELNRITGRRVGIYPEIKHPDFHREHGVDLAARLLEALEAHGYSAADDPVFVQCFDPVELRRCREGLGTRLKLAQLVDVEAGARLSAAASLARIAEYADVVAPHYSQLAVADESGSVSFDVAAAREAAAAGLSLHPYTFRRDQLPPYAATLEELIESFLFQLGVGGVFCDQPDIAVEVRSRRPATHGRD